VPFGALADGLLLLHALFVLFVVAGGVLALRWPAVAWVHLPAAAWGALIELAGFTCPLTPLEQAWRQAAGERPYVGDFIEHYVTAALYPSGLTRPVQIALGLVVLGLNGWIYRRVWRRWRLAGHAVERG
jgi:hypothetical protein